MQTLRKVRLLGVVKGDDWRSGGRTSLQLEQYGGGWITVPLQLIPMPVGFVCAVETQTLIDHGAGTRIDSRHRIGIEVY
jgi:hypothetical protein